VALLLSAMGCAAFRRTQPHEPLGVDEAWRKARGLFERERYARAQTVLHDIVLNYSGSAIIDSAQFYLALTSFETEDYVVAADEFHRVAEQYPSSALVGDALYYEALCYYELSPAYPLDQSNTNKALQDFQRFLEEYPTHALADSGYHYLGLTRSKLARKVYAAASLYYGLDEYASAVLYADVVLDNYYDTPLAEPAQFLKARSFYALKTWDRARAELETYLQKYPTGPNSARAREMQATASRHSEPAASAATP
jgi:outer membrane protein assembly factor BamD